MIADGLTGPLIVHPKEGEGEYVDYNEDQILFLQDFISKRVNNRLPDY
jgi:hypothetical protein